MPRGVNNLKAVKAGRIEKFRGVQKRPNQLLSLGERKLARALANIVGNYQRPDKDLIASMRKRSGLKSMSPLSLTPSTQLATQEAVPADGVAHTEALSMTSCSVTHRNTIPTPRNLPSLYDWEEKAQKAIQRDGLSLDKGWSKGTWKQKSSNIARLKLLKDDGYDITPLEGKVPADLIIDALLAHIEARKQRITDNSGRSHKDIMISSASRVINKNNSLDDSKIPVRTFQRPAIILPEPSLRPKGKLYETTEVIGQRRKHTHEDDGQPEWHEKRPQLHLHAVYNEISTQRDTPYTENHGASSCTCGLSPRKIVVVATPVEVEKEVEAQAFELMKWRASRKIFASSRAARKVFRAHVNPSDGQSHAVPKLVFDPRKPAKPCRVVFTEICSPAGLPSKSDVYMGSVSFNHFKEEIKCLSYYIEKDGSYWIRDHEQGDDLEGDKLMEFSGPVNEPFRHDIRLSSIGGDVTAIEGEPRAIIGLLRHVRNNELTHLGRWQFGDIKKDAEEVVDIEMKVLHNESIPFHLSPATDSALEKIEMGLEEVQDAGGVEVLVGVVYQHAKYTVF